MKKIYHFVAPFEPKCYCGDKDILDFMLPDWVKKQMEEVAEIEHCHIRDLIMKREICFDIDSSGWVDNCTIERV